MTAAGVSTSIDYQGAVIDASALLAYLHDETGGAVVAEVLDGALMSTVNLSEVLQKAAHYGVDTTGLVDDLVELGVCFEPMSASHAALAATLWPSTRRAGLSLADRACLALAQEQNRPVFTADRLWSEISLPLSVVLIR